MKSLIRKATGLTMGLLLNVVAIGALAPHPASAQRVCQSYRVTRDNGLYVYNGDRIITTLPYGVLVQVVGLDRRANWAEIRYLRVDGKVGTGWVAADFLTCFQE